MQNYNVTTDLDKWARVRVQLWDKPRRDAIQREFTRLDREFHAQRAAERARANWRSPEVPTIDPDFDDVPLHWPDGTMRREET